MTRDSVGISGVVMPEYDYEVREAVLMEAGAPAVIVLRSFSFFQYICLPALVMTICMQAGIDPG